ncbi:LuxR C-terminal-related transcriptional regulator [uncultured Serinicoccus sp.]|uniref:LuxR C-terminal-related transcriptional regulator n=1 Tax=uncultured Serinicoccus sp. TaxID=735514 RepID=UPI00261623E5|nr:LuxR C-terminal-related transcriptional regulator [uncultured Serinicoccus sp.]
MGRAGVVRGLADVLGTGGSVLLAGPAGIGKTRLARELCRIETAGGGGVERVLATRETTARPLGTLAPLGVVADDENPVKAFGVFLRRWAERGGSAGSVLLWLDDAHHTDAATAALVRSGVTGRNLRLVGTQRPHRDLPEDLEALVTEGLVQRRVIPPLGRPDAIRLAQATVAPHRLASAQLRSIVALAGGNPLYLRELAWAAARGDRDVAKGPALDLLVGRAVLDLDPLARRVLDMVAVVEPAPLGLFSGVRDELARLRSAGLIEPHGDDTIRTDHPLRRAWLLRELGPHQRDVLGTLLDEVHRSPDLAPDALTLLRWTDGARRPAGRALLERAARTAIAQGRSGEAERVAARLDGDVAKLLRAQAHVIDGDVDGGLERLDHIALGAKGPLRLEALWWSVRHHGLALGRVERAEEMLAAVERDEGGEVSEQLLLRARLWLWAFRGAAPDADLDAAARKVTAMSESPERCEMLAALLAVIGNARGQHATDPLVEELSAADERFIDWPSERLRGRLALGCFYILRLRAGRGAATHTEAYHQARRQHDYECVLSLGGNAGLSQALTGQVTAALNCSAAPAGDPHGPGWMRMDELRRAVHAAALCYAGESTHAADELQALEDGGARDGPMPIAMLLLRLGQLVDETHDRNGSARVIEALERTRARPQLIYLAQVSLETVDLAAGETAVEALAATLPTQGLGLIALAGRCFRARHERRAAPLLDYGLQLEAASLVPASMRVLTDAVRLARNDMTIITPARAGILRLLDRWDGSEPWWLEEVPTPRQREIATNLAAGASTADLADTLGLSRRTVENHLQHVYDYLHVHSRTELGHSLYSPPNR